LRRSKVPVCRLNAQNALLPLASLPFLPRQARQSENHATNNYDTLAPSKKKIAREHDVFVERGMNLDLQVRISWPFGCAKLCAAWLYISGLHDQGSGNLVLYYE
jgi:hypothetical protein